MFINLTHASAYSAEGTGTIMKAKMSWKDLLTLVLKDVNTMDAFGKSIRKHAQVFRTSSDTEAIKAGVMKYSDTELKFIGNMFEVFGEFLVRGHEHDDRLYLRDYSLMNMEDNGIDARAIDSRDGRPVFIQYKCYQESEFFNGRFKPVLLTGSNGHLDSFVAECSMVHQDEYPNPKDYKWDKPYRMIVVTTASEIHDYTKTQKYRGRVECINASHLRQMCDGNAAFWDDFRKSLNIA